MRRATLLLLLPVLLTAPRADAESPTTRARAEEIARLFGRLDVEALGPRLAEEFGYLDVAPGTRHDRRGFLAMLEEMAGEPAERELEIRWVETAERWADLRGVWRVTPEPDGETRELAFSIELTFDDAGRVSSWRDDFRSSSVHKPIRGDRRLETEHFTLVYLAGELPEGDAERLARTMESYYAKTADTLGRAFEPGRRLQINVAGCHVSPYASAPGPDAFILVPLRSARLEYGFSLVHELTHNLMGLSRLFETRLRWRELEFREGNRLLDEGFAVYVEELLTDEPAMFPNWGLETHAGYLAVRAELGQPIWPVLAAEHYRSHASHRGRFTRLAYLEQASFCKYLVETHGRQRFFELYDSEIEAFAEIYGKPLEEVEADWRRFLEMLAAGAGLPF